MSKNETLGERERETEKGESENRKRKRKLEEKGRQRERERARERWGRRERDVSSSVYLIPVDSTSSYIAAII